MSGLISSCCSFGSNPSPLRLYALQGSDTPTIPNRTRFGHLGRSSAMVHEDAMTENCSDRGPLGFFWFQSAASSTYRYESIAFYS